MSCLPFYCDQSDAIFAAALLAGRNPLADESLKRQMNLFQTKRNFAQWMQNTSASLKAGRSVELIDAFGNHHGTLEPTGNHSASPQASPQTVGRDDGIDLAECKRIAALSAELMGHSVAAPKHQAAPVPARHSEPATARHQAALAKRFDVDDIDAERFDVERAQRIAELSKTLPRNAFKNARV